MNPSTVIRWRFKRAAIKHRLRHWCWRVGWTLKGRPLPSVPEPQRPYRLRPEFRDAEGRWWDLFEPALEPHEFDDEDVSVWPTCLACGREIDVLHEAHWCTLIGTWDARRDAYPAHNIRHCKRRP